MAKTKKVSIRGWLLFFIITLVFIQPIMYLYQATGTILDVIILALMVFCITTGVLLWQGKKVGVIVAKWYLITLIVVGILSVWFVCWASPEIDCAFYFGQQSLAIFAYPIIWLTYLRKSKRVKYTYYGIEKLKEKKEVEVPIFGMTLDKNKIHKKMKK